MFGSARSMAGRLAWCVASVLLAAPLSGAEDAWFEIPVDQLEVTEGELPRQWQVDWQRRESAELMIPYVVLDNEGEAWVGSDVAVGDDRWTFSRRFRLRDEREGRGRRQLIFRDDPDPVADAPADEPADRTAPNRLAVAIRAPAGEDVSGTLYVPNSDYTGMVRVRFRVPAAKAHADARTNFYLTQTEHYEMLVSLGVPGGAWFRHRMLQARSTADGRPPLEPSAPAAPDVNARPQVTQWEDTFQIFTGGRAISENLQLDRLLQPTEAAEPTVDIESLRGISVREMDWDALTEGIEPQLDPLAALIPADQHVVFFPSFRTMTVLLDESAAQGAPVLDMAQPRAEDARSRERYERQLCLEIDALARAVGDQVIGGLAFTGSDPYLRTGSDVALLFEARSPELLTAFITARHLAAAQAQRGCRQVNGSVAGVDYTGVVSPDRSISSYVAQFGNAVAVTNSLVQLERLATTHRDRSSSLADLPEYGFFRHRYSRNDEDETALLIVTDATIRRWCGPKWRIATSRRTRAAAILAHHQAQHLDELMSGTARPRPLETVLHVPDLGRLRLTATSVSSSTYGTLDFQTPIAELDLSQVTEDEARAYERWRDGYESYWRQFFDPIAVRFSVGPERLAADVTVMPLIQQSDYNQFIEMAAGAKITADAGDRHEGTLLHWTMAFNAKSALARRNAGFFEGLAQMSPLAWLGESVSIYADADPFWLDLAKAGASGQPDEFLFDNLHRLPVAVRAEVADGLKLALFLAGLRGVVEQTAPGLVTWETLKHNGQSYVKIEEVRPNLIRERLALYYAATPKALTVTFSQDLLKRALDREAARTEPREEEEARPDSVKPWLGESLALQIDGRAAGLFHAVWGDEYRRRMQARSWGNLPVLNEWRRLYPGRDPLKLHQAHWQTELRCPGGGEYEWNEEFQTMASTSYGHAGEPQPGPALPPPLEGVRFLNFGVTFEHDGLRARAGIERGPSR